jgi:cation diffusion facilitator family transporter
VQRNKATTAIRAALLGILVNGTLAIAKLVAGILGNCYALIADAVESMTDIFSSFVVWRGLSLSVQPPDTDHPYETRKSRTLAASFVSLILLAAAIWNRDSSGSRNQTPHHAPKAYHWVLLIVVVIKKSWFRFCVFKVGTNPSTAIRTDAYHHRSDAITGCRSRWHHDCPRRRKRI